MAKQLINIYPKLRSKMAYANHTTKTLSELLEISEDSIRRRLRGEVEFELTEIVTILDFYNCSFEDLFGEEKEAALMC